MVNVDGCLEDFAKGLDMDLTDMAINRARSRLRNARDEAGVLQVLDERLSGTTGGYAALRERGG